MDVKVTIGLRNGSKSAAEAKECGFTEEDGTLGEVLDVVGDSDLVILLISDAAQARSHAPCLMHTADCVHSMQEAPSGRHMCSVYIDDTWAVISSNSKSHVLTPLQLHSSLVQYHVSSLSLTAAGDCT